MQPQKDVKGLILPGDPQFERKASGAFIVDGQEVAHTIQCGHCGNHWTSVKGSGKVRGFCQFCKKPLCGAMPCIRYDHAKIHS